MEGRRDGAHDDGGDADVERGEFEAQRFGEGVYGRLGGGVYTWSSIWLDLPWDVTIFGSRNITDPWCVDECTAGADVDDPPLARDQET